MIETTLPVIITTVTNKLLGSYMWNTEMSIVWSKLQGYKSCGHSLLKTCTITVFHLFYRDFHQAI